MRAKTRINLMPLAYAPAWIGIWVFVYQNWRGDPTHFSLIALFQLFLMIVIAEINIERIHREYIPMREALEFFTKDPEFLDNVTEFHDRTKNTTFRQDFNRFIRWWVEERGGDSENE